MVAAESVPSKPERTTCLHSSIPSPFRKIGNTCYINCILQILIRVSHEFSLDNFVQQLTIADKNDNADAKICLVFYKYLYLAQMRRITSEDLLDFVLILESVNPFFNLSVQRDAFEAIQLVLDLFDHVFTIPTLHDLSQVGTMFSDFFFAGICKETFVCGACSHNNISFVTFKHYTVSPHDNISKLFQNNNIKNMQYTCNGCQTQSMRVVTCSLHEYPKILLLLVNRFSTSSLYHRNRKNKAPIHIYKKIRFGLGNYHLMALVEHFGVDTESGHYICHVRNNNDTWYHCNDSVVGKRVLADTSENAYLLFFVHSH